MYNFKGTQGKWEVVGDAVFAGDNIVASVFDGKSEEHVPMDNELIKANAHLIAEAPQLLEASIELHALHMCEQEGIGAGMPTPEQWMEAVQKLENVINNILTYEE